MNRLVLLLFLALCGAWITSGCVERGESTPDENPTVDSGMDPEPNPYLDLDEDGYPPNDGDCDDTDDTVNPDAEEICDDGIDQDCDGSDLDCEDADQDRDGLIHAMGIVMTMTFGDDPADWKPVMMVSTRTVMGETCHAPR